MMLLRTCATLLLVLVPARHYQFVCAKCLLWDDESRTILHARLSK